MNPINKTTYINFGNGCKIVIAILTENYSNQKDIIPVMAKVIIEAVEGK